MFRQWVRRPERSMGPVIVAVLVSSVANLSVPAFAAPAGPNEAGSTYSAPSATTDVPALSLADQASHELRGALERSAAMDARRLMDAAAQASRSSESSRHWCAGGLALLAGGVTAAVISGVHRDYNPQKPSPPVGVVLGTAAGAVGGIQMIRSCRR